MKKSALIFGITESHDFALANTLLGLKEHSQNLVDDIYVFHSGVSEERQEILNEILPCTFKFYTFPEKYGFDRARSQLHEAIKTYSVPAFSRYNAFDMLEEYRRVLWLDTDILIQRDVSELMSIADDSGLAISQSDQLSRNILNFNKPVPDFDMYGIMYNSGTIVFCDTLAERQKMTQWCYKKTIQYADSLISADQGIFNMLIDHFSINPSHIETPKYVCHPLSPYATKSSIIHAWGCDKFWNNEEYKKLYPKWGEYHDIWLSLLETSKHKPARQNHSMSNNSVIQEFTEAVESTRVTVLMPVYNGEQHLAESINSILNQTYTDFEFLIMVEHGSNAASLEVLQSYADARVVLHFNEKRLGLSESLNVGMRLAKGEYIVRMDGDDISAPGRIETQVAFMDAHPEIGVCGTWLQYFDSTGLRNIEQVPTDPEVYECRMLFNCSLAHSSAILRTSVFRDNNLFYDPTWHIEDHELWSRVLASKACKITNIGEVLLLYRLDDASKTRANILFLLQDYRRLMKRQFRDTLAIDLTSEELSLNDEMVTPWGFMTVDENRRCSAVLKNLYGRMISSNRSCKRFKEVALRKVLDEKLQKVTLRQAVKSRMKTLIKKMIKPFAQPVLNHVSRLVDNSLRSVILRQEQQAQTLARLESALSLTHTLTHQTHHMTLLNAVNPEILSALTAPSASKIPAQSLLYRFSSLSENSSLIDAFAQAVWDMAWGTNSNDVPTIMQILQETAELSINNKLLCYSHILAYWTVRKYVLKDFDILKYCALFEEREESWDSAGYAQTLTFCIGAYIEKKQYDKAIKLLAKHRSKFNLQTIDTFLPVAHFADENGFRNTKIKQSSGLYHALTASADNNALSSLVAQKSVAIVGNGPQERGRGAGKDIDDHDIVIRFNQFACSPEVRDDYGSRTDMWSIYAGVHEPINFGAIPYIFVSENIWETPLSQEYIAGLLSYITAGKTVLICPRPHREAFCREVGIADPTSGLKLVYLVKSLNSAFSAADVYGFSFKDAGLVPLSKAIQPGVPAHDRITQHDLLLEKQALLRLFGLSNSESN